MTKTIKNLLAGLFIVPVLAFGVSLVAPTVGSVSALGGANANNAVQDGLSTTRGKGVPDTLFGTDSIFTSIVNILLFIIGAISVIMLIIGGIKYTISGGDTGQVTSAKNTILYAVIGLVVAFLAFAIVNWVLGSLTTA